MPRLHPEIRRVWPKIAVEFAEQTDHVPYVVSTVRSAKKQRELYEAYRRGKGGRAAPPGRSAHQQGLAIDVNIRTYPDDKWVDAFSRKGRSLYATLHSIARKYGLEDIMRAAPDDPFHLQAPNWRRVAGIK